MDWDRSEEAVWTALAAHGVVDEFRGCEADVAAELSICLTLAQGTKPCSYGVLIAAAPPPARVGRLLTTGLEREELRRVAEGRTLLVWRSPPAPMQLLQLRSPLHTDADSEVLVRATAGILLRVDAGGRVALVTPGAVAHLDGRETWTRPHMDRVVEALESAARAADRRTLGSLANLAYSHVMSAGIGASFVYQLTDADEDSACFSGVGLEALGLNVNDPAHLSGIVHQVQYRDGAVVFGPRGALRRAGVILVPSPEALESVGGVRGGTRHHSAAWHSHDRSDVLCLVVSRTGRVTVFSRGQDVSPAHPALRAGDRHT